MADREEVPRTAVWEEVAPQREVWEVNLLVAKSMNERITESIVRTHFSSDPLFSSIKFEEQISTNIRVAECLANASKSGSGKGKPEFIITFPIQSTDYLIAVECKASQDKHESKDRNQPKDYAVDGALHYSRFLAKEFNVISIAVSGQNKNELRVSNFIQRKGTEAPQQLDDEQLLSIYDYVKTFKNEQLNYNIKDVNIVEKALYLNSQFQNCSITESMRNTLVSGILLALQDDMFKASYPLAPSSQELADLLLAAIKRVLEKSNVRKLEAMLGVYTGILNEPLVKEKTIKRIVKKKKVTVETVDFFKEIIEYLQKKVYPLMNYEESGYDILGRFYTEFIRYAGSKQKQGLVLTPSHVTELFCDLAELKVSDIVYDPCCGTGGFLIAGMKRMVSLAGNDSRKKQSIRQNQLVGVEIRSEMFTFACSNMMLRGDGKSNIDCGDCFNDETAELVAKLKPTVAFLNPPYDKGPDDQLLFIERALMAVRPMNGRVVAIVQMSCALASGKEIVPIKERILKNHTLKAVISMPDELFSPVGVITCIMVFEANAPNAGKKTWFGYLKDDGFVKRKNNGRIDYYSRWSDIKNRFLEAYKNNDEVPGLSVKRSVRPSDEWCAEAYMQTDYSTLRKEDFDLGLKKYAVFKKVGVVDAGDVDGDADDQS